MVNGVVWLLGCQLVGELLVRLTGIPVPGPVVGMLLLFVVLQVRRPDAGAGVLRVADGLLRHLQLFFVPAGVGVVTLFGLIRGDALPILVALAVSWLAGLATAGWLVAALRRGGDEQPPAGAPTGGAA